MATKKRTTKKAAPKATGPLPVDPVNQALKDTLSLYFLQTIAPKMKHEAEKVVAGLVGNAFAEVKPTALGIEIRLVQKLGFGREVSGELDVITEFYTPKGDLEKAVKEGIKLSRTKPMDKGFHVGTPVLKAMKISTDVSFGCGGRTAIQALSQAEQIRVMAHAILALEVYLTDNLHQRDIGEGILNHIKRAKVNAKAAKEAAAAV